MSWYRLTIDWTYSKVPDATAAETEIQNILSQNGRSEVPTRSGSSILVIVEPLTELEAESLRTALIPAWNRGTRSAGKASVVMRDESSG